MADSSMIRIALIGHDTRNDNLGVGALTVSSIQIIRTIAARHEIKVEINVLSGQGNLESCVSGDDINEFILRPLRQPWYYFAAVRRNDLAIDISGGDSFTDIYGSRRIFQVLLQKFLVHLARCPLVMAPQTIGPFQSWTWRIPAAWSIRRCSIIASRDDMSTAFLREIKTNMDRVIEASDVAFHLPYIPYETSRGSTPRVGINVSGLLMNGGYNRNNMFGLRINYPSLIRRIIEYFLSHKDCCEVHLISHVVPQNPGSVENDYQTCLKLAEEYPNVIVAPAFSTPSEVKGYISTLDFFMGARMHACIASLTTHVPVVPMAYSRKFEGLFGALGYNHTVDCTSGEEQEILNRIFEAYEKRTQLRIEAQEASKRGLVKLSKYETMLEQQILSMVCK